MCPAASVRSADASHPAVSPLVEKRSFVRLTERSVRQQIHQILKGSLTTGKRTGNSKSKGKTLQPAQLASTNACASSDLHLLFSTWPSATTKK
jgi:hypothetical protein